jgi:hypothetical protein
VEALGPSANFGEKYDIFVKWRKKTLSIKFLGKTV